MFVFQVAGSQSNHVSLPPTMSNIGYLLLEGQTKTVGGINMDEIKQAMRHCWQQVGSDVIQSVEDWSDGKVDHLTVRDIVGDQMHSHEDETIREIWKMADWDEKQEILAEVFPEGDYYA